MTSLQGRTMKIEWQLRQQISEVRNTASLEGLRDCLLKTVITSEAFERLSREATSLYDPDVVGYCRPQFAGSVLHVVPSSGIHFVTMHPDWE